MLLLVWLLMLAAAASSWCCEDLPSPDVRWFWKDDEPVLLSIGGDKNQSTGGLRWFNVNAQNKTGNTDVIRLMHDLRGFPNSSVAVIYASHCLEHVDQTMTVPVLIEWLRVLIPGGLLLVSVPDLTTLFEMFLRGDVTHAGRRFLLNCIYGGGVDEYDIHRTGFTHSSLAADIASAGFHRSERIGVMRYFVGDSSSIVFGNKLVSINLAAWKAPDDSAKYVVTNADPYLDSDKVNFSKDGVEIDYRDVFPNFFIK